MLDGIYSFEITFLGTEIKGIAMSENNNIRGFNWSHVYKIERSEKHGEDLLARRVNPARIGHARDSRTWISGETRRRRGRRAVCVRSRGGSRRRQSIDPRSSAM